MGRRTRKLKRRSRRKNTRKQRGGGFRGLGAGLAPNAVGYVQSREDGGFSAPRLQTIKGIQEEADF
jgi:hypothetical protein